MDFIRIDSNIKYKIDSISELENNEKYLCMFFLNKILFSYFYSIKQNNHFDKEFFVNKSIKGLQYLFGSDKNTYKCINVLEKNNLIERGNSYVKDKYSKGFKPLLNITGKFVTVKINNYLNVHQITNLRKRIQKKRSKDLEWHLNNLKRDIELDLHLLSLFIDKFFGVKINCFDDRDKYIEQVMNIPLQCDDMVTNAKQYFYKMKILDLLDLENTEIVKGEKGGRHYHALSNTPTDLKRCLVSKNMKKPFLIQIDIKNSQPFFLLCLIEKANLEIEESMKIAILNGKFYEKIGEVWGYNFLDITENKSIRKEVKEMVFKYLFFCKNNTSRLNNENFKKIRDKYPLFALAIEKVADVKNRTLASLLQEIETKEMLPIVRKFKAIGIHDAVVLITVDKQTQVEKVKVELFNRFKKKYKMTPQVSVELLSEREEGLKKLFTLRNLFL